jgi:thioesterase domain-containing protein
VHGVGGNVLEYFHLAQYLPPDRPLYGIQAQGLDGKRPRLRRVEDMAPLYVHEIRTLQPQGPYYLAGSSFGGYVAYEMAQELLAQGQEVAFLGLIDTHGPGYPRLLPGTTALTRQFNRWRFRTELHWGNLRVATSQGRLNYVCSKAHRLSADLRKQLRKRVRVLARRMELLTLPQALKEVRQAGREASARYVPKDYPGRVVLFRATDQPYGIYPDPTLGWGTLITGGLEIIDIPGHHGAIIREPRVGALAKELNACLLTSQSPNGSRPAAANRSHPAPEPVFFLNRPRSSETA